MTVCYSFPKDSEQELLGQVHQVHSALLWLSVLETNGPDTKQA
jgi:hypothetical protein